LTSLFKIAHINQKSDNPAGVTCQAGSCFDNGRMLPGFRSSGLRCGQLAVTVGLRYVATPVFSSQTLPAVYDRRAIRREKLAGKA